MSQEDFSFKIQESVREAVPPLISLWSKSGGGKTYSALLLARGMVGPSGKIVVIDTENGRSKFYSDVSAPWFHLDLQPPFTPDKYKAAFEFSEKWGADVIIVDSGSHVWEGEGGVIDMADRNGGSGLQKWNAPKMAHKRMMNNLTRSPIPVIFCLRAKEGVKQVGNKIEHVGLVPIAERNFVFEMTLDLCMTKDGHYDLEASKTVPEGLRGVVTKGGRVTSEMGKKIAEWMGSGAKVDAEFLKLKRDGQEAAMSGLDAYRAWTASLSEDQKSKVRHLHSGWVAEAKTADADAAMNAPPKQTQQGPSGASALDDSFTGTCTNCNGRGVIVTDDSKEPCPNCSTQKNAA
ncbi:AAA family ATPase [Micavibrio aeruginosavorus]|uniref:AAA family ATPase n=1 Tax=Micavibrio aeruginosavorus (strain ARL-13) TaxID=856793 RepID=G2KMZ3_MICAA|nr:AAA family ATPase [Micavibrio aeruginosavorus]AEP08925.1 hypothetical protein MICA_588 [Micavibrio aeruginosavorus ARL-13]